MSGDNTIEQLLARAILDLELLEALINRDSHGHAPRNSMQHYSSGGRHSLHTTTTGRVSYYPRSPNLANGHPHHGGGTRPTSKRLSTIGSPASTVGYGSGWVPSSAPSNVGRSSGGIQQHKHAYERKQYQSKQPLGTGGNRANLGEKSVNKTPWPSRGGNFTDDVSDASDDDNSSQTGSESPYSVAKPACKPEDECINKETEEEDNVENEEDSEKLNCKEQGVLEGDGEDDNASAKMNGGSNVDSEEKENNNNDDNKVLEPSVVVTSTIVTPGAMISPVVGGFGRSRRN
uniref:Uncharacterized protein n=1 Tax=Meloidogyne hapla TaxID=6305 RepID=A0A1I8B4Z2_MELHA